jgi:transcriptional regulator with XRE-family HTH domain
MSLKTLADVLGVSFQQLQKYEKGKNRISASTLVRLAAALETSVGALVEGAEYLWPQGSDELLAAYRKAPEGRRADILRVVRILAELR